MMKIQRMGIILILLATTSLSTFADDGTTANTTDTSSSSSSDETSQYLKNLGVYLGYDLTADLSQMPIVDYLLNYTLTLTQQNSQVLQAFLSAIPINNSFLSFTAGTSYDSFVNPFANILFTNSYANTSSSDQASVTCNFDQQTFQADPVSQSILNILATPDWTMCPPSTSTSSSNSGASGSTCQQSTCMSLDQVMGTALQDTNSGVLPSENDYYTYATNSKFISQLNSDNLIGPLVYTTNSAGGSSSAGGLPSQNQIQQAQEFIRYVTEAVTPMPTMNQSDFSSLYQIASTVTTDSNGNPKAGVDVNNVMNAKVALQSYLLGLRVYAAKNSVVQNNLYYMLSRRMPQTTTNGSGDKTVSSDALNEFQMATWRLYNPSQNDQWVAQINQASPSTIQKEMAVLLSEINYQLYKNRMMQERLVLTDSVLLLALLSVNKPSPYFPNSVDRDTTASE